MDTFLQDHKDFFTRQVTGFQPPKAAAAAGQGNEDITIAARLRPLLPGEVAAGDVVGVSVHPEAGAVAVHELRKKFNGAPGVTSSSFRLDKVYGPSATSEEVYRDLVVPLVPWAWGGGVSTLFAYGQTGSGKTYTVSALEELAAAAIMGGDDSGVLKGERTVHVCVVELEGAAAFDLLNDRRPVNVLEDSFGETQLVGAVEHLATSASDLLAVLARGMAFRKTEATAKNDTSSRTHAVCRLRITDTSDPAAADGLLFLVDLAGSEVSADSKLHSAARMKETRDINLSLATLKDCIRGRTLFEAASAGAGAGKAGKKAPHIPWRASLLTKVLKHVFDPSSPRAAKTAVLACVKPSAADVAPGKNSLRYAEMLRAPIPKSKPAAYNPAEPRTWNNEQLRKWIAESSGSPVIDGSVLAPTESGLQLLKLPKGAFVARCQPVAGSTEALRPENARAFYDKFWRLHVDSRNPTAAAAGAAAVTPTVPWQDRIKPGMFVRTPRAGGEFGTGVVMVMAPEKSWDAMGEERRFVCCAVLPTVMMDAYELAVEHQLTVAFAEMEEEVRMEWDSAIRYWFMDI
ncbi:P-loop containing nucleoside triphosphate hydrolase protein [Geopyxis carbonaria]|nr:P-loop containing nucleoside triphosphate hydrolase protein [Geopyxis carbonaria]